MDANCPVQGVYDVEARFGELGKDNLTVNIYEGYDHGLNLNALLYGAPNAAMDDIAATAKALFR